MRTTEKIWVHPELQEGEILLLNVKSGEDWESNLPDFIQSVRRGNTAYTTGGFEIVHGMQPLFAKIKPGRERKEQWFKLDEKNSEGDEIEYAFDFMFFVEHQIRIVKSGLKYSFCSKLEAKTFREIEVAFEKGYELCHELSDKEQYKIIKEIHQEVLAGKHGAGKIVE